MSIGHTTMDRLMLCAAVALGAVAASAAAANQPPTGFEDPDYHIVINVKPGTLEYDQTAFTVEPGATVELVLNNPDSMLHNLVICRPGEGVHLKVAALALQLGGEALKKDYVPDSDLVLFHTDLLQPQASTTLYFRAPADTGDYPYVCTLPGHARTMNGVMHVGDAPPPAAAGPIEATDTPTAIDRVTYQYFEGQWQNLPDFAALTPKAAGVPAGGGIGLEPRQRDEHYALLFRGVLTAPTTGDYRFYIRSDDGSAMWIDGERVLDNDGRHAPRLEHGRVHLTRGEHRVKLAYFNGPAGGLLQVAWAPPGASTIEPLSASGDMPQLSKFFRRVADRPLVYRVRLPDASNRSLAVGLPDTAHGGGHHGRGPLGTAHGTSYCFDPVTGAVRYGWRGEFLDVGPQLGYGTGRGGGVCTLLGDRFGVGAVAHPLRIGSPDAAPDTEFLGYRRLGDDPPQILLRVDGIEVSQTVEASPGQAPGLRYTFAFTSTPPGTVYFVVKPEGLKLSSSAGNWRGGVLAVRPDEARRFSITIVDTTGASD